MTRFEVTRHKGHGALSGVHDIAVVIDVIRAFTFAKTAFDGGAAQILLADDVEDARALARAHDGALLAGEVDALPIPGFDMGNSPAQAAGRDVRGRTIVHRTTNGTRMAIAALAHAPEVLVTGLSNAPATAAHISTLGDQRLEGPGRLLLIATHPTGDEDVACGDHLLDLLGLPGGISPGEALTRTRSAEAAAKFLDPAQPAFPREDMDHVLSFHPPAYVMRVRAVNGVPTVQKISL